MSKEQSVFSNNPHKSTLEQHVLILFFDFQRSCSVKNKVLKNFANFTGKHLCQNLLLVAGFAGSATYLKKTPTQVFSCGICETFKKIFLVEHLQTAAPGSCKHSIWTCFEIKDVDSTELFRKMKLPLPPPHLKERLVERLKVSVENSS